jgi:hypothetical protein
VHVELTPGFAAQPPDQSSDQPPIPIGAHDVVPGMSQRLEHVRADWRAAWTTPDFREQLRELPYVLDVAQLREASVRSHREVLS